MRAGLLAASTVVPPTFRSTRGYPVPHRRHARRRTGIRTAHPARRRRRRLAVRRGWRWRFRRWSSAPRRRSRVYPDPTPRRRPTSSSRRVRRVIKGVVIEHRSIVNRLRWMDDTFHLTPDDRVAQKTPYSFDVSVWEFFWPLIRGASLVLMTPGVEKDGPRWPPSSPGAASPSAISSRPRWAFLAAAPRRRRRWKALRLIVCSGEGAAAEGSRRGRELLPATLIDNRTAPTEAAVDVTEWAPGPHWDGTEVPIGSPSPIPRPTSSTGAATATGGCRPSTWPESNSRLLPRQRG